MRKLEEQTWRVRSVTILENVPMQSHPNWTHRRATKSIKKVGELRSLHYLKAPPMFQCNKTPKNLTNFLNLSLQSARAFQCRKATRAAVAPAVVAAERHQARVTSKVSGKPKRKARGESTPRPATATADANMTPPRVLSVSSTKRWAGKMSITPSAKRLPLAVGETGTC